MKGKAAKKSSKMVSWLIHGTDGIGSPYFRRFEDRAEAEGRKKSVERLGGSLEMMRQQKTGSVWRDWPEYSSSQG